MGVAPWGYAVHRGGLFSESQIGVDDSNFLGLGRVGAGRHCCCVLVWVGEVGFMAGGCGGSVLVASWW